MSMGTFAGSGQDEAWREAALKSCLNRFLQRSALADRGALLREAARLNHGVLSLPGASVSGGLAAAGSRFGLGIRYTETEGHVFLEDSYLPAGCPPELQEALRLGTSCRRPSAREVADAPLLRLSPHSDYHNPTQKAAVRALVTMPPGATLLVSMPTGSGKSLLFQFGARWWSQMRSATVLVIVPTIALGLDHAKSARSFPGLEGAVALSSSVSEEERLERLEELVQGVTPLMFISPEMALGQRTSAYLREAAERKRLVAIVVDEAHIIESWGRSFRPDFQRLPGLVGDLRTANPDLRLLLLSATIDDDSRNLLRRQYRNTDYLEVSAGVPRYEFDLLTQELATSAARNHLVAELLDVLPRPCIVYTTRVRDAEALHAQARANGYESTALFTGETSGSERERIVSEWSTGALDLVFATSAFGLGVDKSDVRCVVHACVPEDAARYYQEIGRGGRDGHQSLALCLWTGEDLQNARQMQGQLLRPEVAVSRWHAIVEKAKRELSLETVGGRLTMRASLDALREGLGRHSGGHNRRWNRALLTQLQRADYLRCLLADEAHDSWLVEVLRPEILEDDEALASAVAQRDEEQDRLRQALDDLVEVLRSDGTAEICQLVRLFEKVEAGAPLAELCGRCRVCRSAGIPPPRRVTFLGTRAAWKSNQVKRSCSLSPGVHVVHPEYRSQPGNLLCRLVRLGLDQWIVPDRQGEAWAERLHDEPRRLGFLLLHRHLREQQFSLLGLPTVLLMEPGDPEAVLEQTLAERGDEQVLVLIAPEDYQFRGRPVAQVAGIRPPYSEEDLGLLEECEDR